MTNHDGRLFAVVALQHGLGESPGPVRAPDRLLGVVGLGLGLPLHLQRHAEVGGGVRILAPASPQLDMTRHPESGQEQRQQPCARKL